jgi:hypothetical protein
MAFAPAKAGTPGQPAQGTARGNFREGQADAEENAESGGIAELPETQPLMAILIDEAAGEVEGGQPDQIFHPDIAGTEKETVDAPGKCAGEDQALEEVGEQPADDMPQVQHEHPKFAHDRLTVPPDLAGQQFSYKSPHMEAARRGVNKNPTEFIQESSSVTRL